MQVVDGQQRLTTFQLFLSAIREVARNYGCKNVTEHVRDYLFNKLKSKDTDKLTQFKLTPTPSDQSVIFDIVKEEYSTIRSRYQEYYWGGRVPKNTQIRALRAYEQFYRLIDHFAQFGSSELNTDSDEGRETETIADETDTTQAIEIRLEAMLTALLKARRQALILLASVSRGEDPAGERQAERNAITVAQLAEQFDREHIAVRVKPSTAKEYRRSLHRLILPALGRLKVADVSRADIARFHHELRHIPYQSNRNLEIISKMFGLAELWGLRPDGSNPRRHIKKYPEEKRQRYLSAAELAALGEALSRAESQGIEDEYAIAAIRLLIFTGCRLGEIMTLRWEFVDEAGSCLRLPDTKTSARVVHLGAPALDVLRGIRRQLGNPWVICGRLPGSRRTDLQPPWQRLRKRATVRLWARAEGSEEATLVGWIESVYRREPLYDECVAEAESRKLDLTAGPTDVRIHDLRHSFASNAVGLGQSLPMIGKLLGHTKVQTTARYAHLAADPVQAAAEQVTSSIAAILNGARAQERDTDAA